jgi:cyclic beta-1,2-glucan synthetase
MTRSRKRASERSAAGLEEKARQLAAGHLAKRCGGVPVHLKRLKELEALFENASGRFSVMAEEKLELPSAAEWLLDNFYLIHQAVREVRQDLPPAFYRQLPVLEESPPHGLLRIYALAHTLTTQCTIHSDPENIRRFVSAYQSVAALTIGELWALPAMLRLAVLERLGRSVAALLESTGTGPHAAPEAAPSPEPAAPPAEEGEGECQVSDAVLDLRAIDVEDWKVFFENISLVERILRSDPSDVYARMDFETRDRYRKTVEEIAARTGKAETAVAEAAVALAEEESLRRDAGMSPLARRRPRSHLFSNKSPSQAGNVCTPPSGRERPRERGNSLFSERSAHVGYYLIERGRDLLEQRLEYRPAAARRLRCWLEERGLGTYLGTILALSALISTAIAWLAYASGGAPWQVLLAGLCGIVPALTVAVGLVHTAVPHLVQPQLLPKMDFQDGIPAECRTLIVIPTLLEGPAEIRRLLRRLEQHYLNTLDEHLHFALLSDYVDAPQEHMPGDEALLSQAREGILALNQKYGAGRRTPFHLLHRPREWNPLEGVWMGWERKRGKLVELVRRLSGGEPSTRHPAASGEDLPPIRYVITLDADSLLTRDGARRLIATIAHPLNQAQFDPQSGRLASGYTVLQPRVRVFPTNVTRTLFTRLFAGDPGLDLYTQAVSDVYQDLFQEGIYVGKGILDVSAFRRCIAGRVPENALLSHDLFEGILGRAALVTDVVLLENFPTHYLAYSERMHRWTRGDWQLLPWLFSKVPAEGGREIPNFLSALDRWKVIDNLRRSLLPPAILCFLLAGWLWLPPPALLWTVLAMLAPGASLMAGVALNVRLRWPDILSLFSLRPLWMDLARWGLAIVLLPYEAMLSLDAIAIALIRMAVTHRRMLQWTPAESIARAFRRRTPWVVTWRRMFSAPVVAVAAGIWIALTRADSLALAVPLLAAWLLSPLAAQWISRPITYHQPSLTPRQRQTLRCLARRTWLYYERFIGPEDNWLPPDHFQESPRGLAAHHTSPTNIGFQLLAYLAAGDLGYIGTLGLTLRLNSTLDTLQKMERYRGHFLNWYDTRTLAPLSPAYVSTVDSGNLAACLIALSQACQAMPASPVLRIERWQGLLDTLAMLAEELEPIEETPALAELNKAMEAMVRRIRSVENDAEHWLDNVKSLSAHELSRLENSLLRLAEDRPPSLSSEILDRMRISFERVRYHLMSMQREVTLLLPWMETLLEPPGLLQGKDCPAPLAQEWQRLTAALPAVPLLADSPEICREAEQQLKILRRALEENRPAPPEDERWSQAEAWCTRMASELQSSRLALESLLLGLRSVSERADALTAGMDFCFLFAARQQVFCIGYNVEAGKLDDNHYDLLASEARLASLVAIAKRDVPMSHWLHLGRPLIKTGDSLALLSWSGTMFEFLMPNLLARSYPGTLLDQTCAAAVRRQIQYARGSGAPWGISESGFFAFDAAQNYQYRAFGVPGLGFKRGLGKDQVIAPYASILALPQDARAVLTNLDRLKRRGMIGRYGLYESLDCTPSRMPKGKSCAVVRSYMSHHHGMILVSLLNALQEEIMVRRFHADARIQTVELLLQEQLPAGVPLAEPSPPIQAAARTRAAHISINPWRAPTRAPAPQVHMLSNGRYGVLLTGSGGGYSRWKNLALTRWTADPTCEGSGVWIYIKDFDSGRVISPTVQPLALPYGDPQALFFPYKAEFYERNLGLALKLEVALASDDDVEIRNLTVTNLTDRTRKLMIASYGEAVLAPLEDDRRHPAFNKMFIESEFLEDQNALLLRRRPRSDQEEPVFLLHKLVTRPGARYTLTHESSRERFLGRGRTTRHPAFLDGAELPQAGPTGATLDPVFSLARDLRLGPRSVSRMAFLTLAGSSRDEVIALARRYDSPSYIDRMIGQSRSDTESELREKHVASPDLEAADRLLSALLYPGNRFRASARVLTSNRKGQAGLWGFGISGDNPILLVRLHDEEETAVVRDVLRAHARWRRRGIQIDLVLLVEKESGYAQELQGKLYRLVVGMDNGSWINQRGGIFLLSADQMAPEDRVLLSAAARVIFDGSGGPLAAQLGPPDSEPTRLPEFQPAPAGATEEESTWPLERPDGLLFDNGLGGFLPDGSEYQIFLREGQHTPRPWINVIANPSFGFLVSESGGGFTWAANSSENRLTPWTNDPVSDEPGEALFLRDEESAAIWSPTPEPAPGPGPYLIRHGRGYTIFTHRSRGLHQELRMFAAADAPVKVIALKLRNLWRRPRRLTATYYARWVLGTHPDATAQYVIPEYEPAVNAILARNPYNAEFASRCAFLASSHSPHGLTADRTEFLGRFGTLREPAALARIGLSGAIRAGLDPCAAIMVHVELLPGQEQEVFFLLGEGENRGKAIRLARSFGDPRRLEEAWKAACTRWEEILDAVQAKTPDPALDVLLNRWLLYQALSCRVWGRSALYQSGGGYGFRDQLQDVMALVHTAPEITRSHILEAARRQFTEGDVLHWWHPPSGRGVRTHFSDDLLWLPFAVSRYVEVTGDEAILAERVPFLEADPLKPEENERYAVYESGSDEYELREHCRRALERGSTSGAHGLPLIGSGDWNDGFNLVGAGGKGESVWLAWFLRENLIRFAHLCRRAGRPHEEEALRMRAQELLKAIEASAWDGGWYRRAYYDDGTPLGSAENAEWRIDSLPQSWAVFSGAADPERVAQAMNAVMERLVRPAEKLILLADPPFDATERDPGYIRGYPPGVRENGGMYVHAAVWAARAMLQLGRAEEAHALFSMINPIRQSASPEDALRYGVEPYAVAADISNQPGFAGRGGWSWYTGSAGWLYRLGLEGILGVRRKGGMLQIHPCIPKAWPGYSVRYRFGKTSLHIEVQNPDGVSSGVRTVRFDGQMMMHGDIPLSDDGGEHEAVVVMGDPNAGS